MMINSTLLERALTNKGVPFTTGTFGRIVLSSPQNKEVWDIIYEYSHGYDKEFGKISIPRYLQK